MLEGDRGFEAWENGRLEREGFEDLVLAFNLL